MAWAVAAAASVLAGCALVDDPAGGGPGVAGLYSTRHPVTVDGDTIFTAGYLLIAPDGKMTVYTHQGTQLNGSKRDCYELANGAETDAPLQGGTLAARKAPTGDADYESARNGVVFGVLADRAAGEPVRWFVHAYKSNNTVNIRGLQNVVMVTGQAYAITGAPLGAREESRLRSKLCPATARRP